MVFRFGDDSDYCLREPRVPLGLLGVPGSVAEGTVCNELEEDR